MTKEKITVDFSSRNAFLKCSPETLRLLREKFSVINPSFQARKFSPRKHAVTPSGAFQIGMWEEIEGYLMQRGIPTQIVKTPAFKAEYKSTIDTPIQTIDGYTYYDYQEETIRLFLEQGRGIGLLATSAGKTLILAGLCKSLLHKDPNCKILIMVPDVGLLMQFRDEFVQNFALTSVTQWGNKLLPDLSKSIVIANSQILLSDIKTTIKYFKDYDYVIVDEVHSLGQKSNKINKIIHNIPTPHKFGVTGTLPNNLLACWNIIGKMGPILIEESSFSIKEKGRATPVEVWIYRLNVGDVPEMDDTVDSHPTDRYINESTFIYTHPKRNRFILDLADKVKGNVLVLVDKLVHGNSLMNMDTTKKKVFIWGEMPVEERQKIINEMEIRSDMLVIAMSQIFARGISIKNLKFVVFCAIGKSNIRICQAIGRAMRLHANKEKSYIFDVSDQTYYSTEHIRERIQIYKEEQIPYKIKKFNLI